MGDDNLRQRQQPAWGFWGGLTELTLFFVALLIIGLDQYTKHLVREGLELGTSHNPLSWLEPIVTLTHVRNTGAAFGLFPGMQYFFAAVALVVVALIVVYHKQLTDDSFFLHMAFGLQLGGATGNLIDRILQGYVTDFIDFRVWPVFNVADSAVVVGTILLVYYTFFLSAPAESESDMESLDSEIARGC